MIMSVFISAQTFYNFIETGLSGKYVGQKKYSRKHNKYGDCLK